MTPLELLSPARNLECGKAAIDCGADAVYIGAAKFGARAAVGNSVDDIAALCSYAHQYRAKVYVTINTLIEDGEKEEVRTLLQQLEEAGADAILIQDMSLIEMLRGSRMAMHASTQTDNRTASKVSWLASQGFQRTVLARELSLQEIADIHRSVPEMPLEVFVHGALCVSYSGLCYASEYCFQRSANRGMCAQFCRLKFDLVDSVGSTIERGRYLLSLKDMNQSQHLGALIEAGATSFKIEGRLKDITYVKNVTAAYSQLLDDYIAAHPESYCRASLGKSAYPFTPTLNKTFNRGFTSYFINGRQQDISSPDTPKAIGEYVGKVKEIRGTSFNVAGTATFANGDGLCFINRERTLEGFRVNRVEGNRLFPQKMPQGLYPGAVLYRNNDKAFEDALSQPVSRKIPVSLTLSVVAEGIALTIATPLSATPLSATLTPTHSTTSFSATPLSATVTAAIEHQQARTPQHESIISQLKKLGNTIFECHDITLPQGFNIFIPNSLLSDLRRQACAALLDVLIQPDITHNSSLITHNSSPITHNSSTITRSALRDAFLLSQASKDERPTKNHSPLMQCRYCLRHALGHCVKHGGSKPTWSEPLFLTLPDQRRFRLEFDCKHCQMNLYADVN